MDREARYFLRKICDEEQSGRYLFLFGAVSLSLVMLAGLSSRGWQHLACCQMALCHPSFVWVWKQGWFHKTHQGIRHLMQSTESL